MKQRLQHFKEFIQYDLWRQSHMNIHNPRKRLWYRILQTIILVARGFKDQVLVVRAVCLHPHDGLDICHCTRIWI